MFPYGSNIAETFKEFPVPVISLLETLLSIDPDLRGTAATALNSEVLLDFESLHMFPLVFCCCS